MRRFSRAFPSPHAHIFVNTVAQNELLYSKREVEEAKQARELSRMLAFPSFKDISEAISSGTLIDCPVTTQSLKRSIVIYGTPDSILKGKINHTTKPPDKIITITRPPDNDVRLDGDIFFIEGIAFLLTCSTPINLLGVTALANRTMATTSKHIAYYRSRGFKVVEVFLYSESGLIALNRTYQLRGLEVTYAPPGQHIPVIERKIRFVKERCRALLGKLLYANNCS